ncbi:MAG: hypothetical protein KDE56_10110 [Anaerolineales bacterium]|nr:hypothetical protein [Anaerolineales bacterium]
MPTLHVRNVPESIYKQIQERAQEQNRSFSAEVVMLLDYALASTQQSQKEVLAGIRRRRFFKPEAVGAPDTTTLLREDRER